MPRFYVFVLALLTATAVLPVVDSSGTAPTVDAVNVGLYSHYWSPSQISVAPGGEVTLRNTTTTRHGVNWVGGPAKPSCDSSVPVGTTEASAGTEWSGNCTFTQAGTYTFYCTVHGPEMTGTVTVAIPGAPTATTGAASAVSETGATLEGTVNPGEKATTYHFNYGTSASYGLETAEEAAGAGTLDKEVSATVSGLAPGTTYHYQLVAKNGAATVPGADRTFTTVSPPGLPTATTGAATALGEKGATLNGAVNPDGQATEYFFEWGTGTGYGQVTGKLSAGADRNGHAESALLTGLAAGTAYHYRLVAENASGPSFGADHTFTTLSPTESPSTTPTPTTTTQTTPPPSTPPLGSLLGNSEPLVSGPPLLTSSVKLSAPRHATAVRGSLEVGQAGAGGRLEVDVLAKAALLAKSRGSHSKSVRVGRLVRSSVSAGKLPFSVTLTAAGKRALARHHRLAVTVKITLTPTRGATVTLMRGLTLRS